MPLLLLGLLSGCGYQQGSLYRGDVQTVAVPTFTNRTYQLGMEQALSKAIVHRLEGHSPWKVVSRDKADAILEGQIVSLDARPLSRDFQTNLPREQSLSVAIDFVLKDLRSGRILCERRNFQVAATYYPTLGEGRFAGEQQAAERLALAIVQELQSDW